MFHYCVHKSLPPILILTRIHPVHTFPPFSLRSFLILSSHLCLDLLCDLFPSVFLIKILYAFLSVIHYVKQVHNMTLLFDIIPDVSENVEVSTSVPADIGRSSRAMPA